MDISSLLNGVVGNTVISTVASKLNVEPSKAKYVVSAAVPLIIAALNYNAKNKGQEANIANALSQHNGGILQNVAGLLSPNVVNDGSKILGHVFGKNSDYVTQELASKSGISTAQVGNILSVVAPVVMGMLGQQKQANANGGVTDLIGSLLSGGSSSNAGGGLLGNLIGSVLGGGSKPAQAGPDLGSIMDLAGTFFNQGASQNKGNVLDNLAGLFGK